mmetsp:Transcript_68797/g.110892  ORF Transcript_68797/g.110892 Transcript_68797/m.110892 type:complete len:204 (-) Transcript_68797:24-635(-)
MLTTRQPYFSIVLLRLASVSLITAPLSSITVVSSSGSSFWSSRDQSLSSKPLYCCRSVTSKSHRWLCSLLRVMTVAMPHLSERADTSHFMLSCLTSSRRSRSSAKTCPLLFLALNMSSPGPFRATDTELASNSRTITDTKSCSLFWPHLKCGTAAFAAAQDSMAASSSCQKHVAQSMLTTTTCRMQALPNARLVSCKNNKKQE